MRSHFTHKNKCFEFKFKLLNKENSKISNKCHCPLKICSLYSFLIVVLKKKTYSFLFDVLGIQEGINFFSNLSLLFSLNTQSQWLKLITLISFLNISLFNLFYFSFEGH